MYHRSLKDGTLFKKINSWAMLDEFKNEIGPYGSKFADWLNLFSLARTG
jgi:hypothetical protein